MTPTSFGACIAYYWTQQIAKYSLIGMRLVVANAINPAAQYHHQQQRHRGTEATSVYE
jgi:hypothetical protein